jgi:hypothetical protein
MRYSHLLVFLLAHLAFADIAVTVDARKDLKLTVYRDFGLVKDTRKINIPEGANRIRFEGVATGIDAKSVNVDWKSDVDIEMIAQSYEFDLVSPTKLMEKYVGREIEIVPRKDEWFDTTLQIAELISINGKEPVFRIGTKITFGDIGRILFPYMPDNLYTKPTLVWNVFIPKRQKTEIAATYLTEGFSWEAAYRLQIGKNDEKGSFGGWISFHNQSGLDCKNAQVTFVAGNVRRVRQKQTSDSNGQGMDLLQQYGDYSFYEMNQRITILSNHVKEVEWIPEVQVNFKKKYYAEVDAISGSVNNVNVFASVEVENSEGNNIGLPLPEGILRIYKNDVKGNNRFIGENRLADTKVGRSFFAPVSKINDVAVSHKKLSDGSSYQLFVKNNKKKSVSLKLHVNTGGLKVKNSSNKYRIVYGSSLEWNIVVKSRETYKISYSLEQSR